MPSRASSRPSSSKPTFHSAWKPCRLPVMVMSCWRGQPQPHRAAGDGRAEGRDGGVPVRLHLLAAEAAAHPQALHGHLVALHPEDVGDDLLGLGGVLGAALHEDLAALVDQREGGVGLEVEVLLAGHLGLAGEHVRGVVEGPLDVAALDGRRPALEAAGCDRLADRHQRRQRLVVDLDRRSPASGGLQRLAEHPDDGVAVVHHLVGEQRLVVLDARVVEAGHVAAP